MSIIRSYRIFLLWNHIGDYHRARISALAQRHDVQFLISGDLGKQEALYPWQSTEAATHVVLSDKAVNQFDFFTRVKRAKTIIIENDIQVLGLAGYARPEYLYLARWAKRRSIKIILFAESWYRSSWLIEQAKSRFLHKYMDGLLVSGVRAQEHFSEHLAVPQDRIRIGYSVVDNDHFVDARSVKKADPPVLLCVARYSPEKNLVRLMEAFYHSQLKGRWQLWIAGDGPQRSELQKIIGENGQLKGWVPYRDLPGLYHQASAFILASSFEPWGLAINEAMAAGLPVLASRQCGAAPDLLDPAYSWVFDAENTTEISSCLNQLAETPPNHLRAMGEQAQQKIQGWSPAFWARQFLSLADEAGSSDR